MRYAPIRRGVLRPLRERLCLIFAWLAAKLAGQQFGEPLCWRRTGEVVMVTHPCSKVVMSPETAGRLAAKLRALSFPEDFGRGNLWPDSPKPADPFHRLTPSVN